MASVSRSTDVSVTHARTSGENNEFKNKIINQSKSAAAKNTTSPNVANERAAVQAGQASAASFQKAANTDAGRNAISKALTGNEVSKLSEDQSKKIDNFLSRLADNKVELPRFTSAAEGSQDDVKFGNAALGNEILLAGTRGAYVESGNIALLSSSLNGEALLNTAKEETGEALAAAARRSGITVAQGDVGDRLADAVSGKVLDPADFKADVTDKTIVNIAGKEIEAVAARPMPKMPLHRVGFSIKIRAADKLIVDYLAKEDGREVWKPFPGTHWPTPYNTDFNGHLTVGSYVKDPKGYPQVRVHNLTTGEKIFTNRRTTKVFDNSAKETRTLKVEDRPYTSFPRDYTNVQIDFDLRRVTNDNYTKLGGLSKRNRLHIDRTVESYFKKVQRGAYPGLRDLKGIQGAELKSAEDTVKKHAETLAKAGLANGKAAQVAMSVFAWGSNLIISGARYNIYKGLLVGANQQLQLPNGVEQVINRLPDRQRYAVLAYTTGIMATYLTSGGIYIAGRSQGGIATNVDRADAVQRALGGIAGTVALGSFGGIAWRGASQEVRATLGKVAAYGFNLSDFIKGSTMITQSFNEKLTTGARILKAIGGASAVAGAFISAGAMMFAPPNYQHLPKLKGMNGITLALATALDMVAFTLQQAHDKRKEL